MQGVFSFFTKRISFLYDLPIWSLVAIFIAILLIVFVVLLAVNKAKAKNSSSRIDVLIESAAAGAMDTALSEKAEIKAADEKTDGIHIIEEELKLIEPEKDLEDTAKLSEEKAAEQAAQDVAELPEEKAAEQTELITKKTDTQAENEKTVLKKPTDKKQGSDKDTAAEKLSPSGKYYIDVRQDGYHFYLTANNGQLIYDSFSFTTMQGALNGINTFKKTVDGDKFIVYKDKFGRYRFVLNKRYVGENYTTRAAAESSKESVKRFANNSAVVPYTPDEAAEKEYEKSKASANVSDNVDWNAVFDRKYKQSGKYEIDKEEDGFHFYLVANNGQLLYSSRSYSTASGAIDGITAFKKAVHLGNFYVDEDKFGKFRYILKGTGSVVMYVGESFDTKISALNNVESVKNFAFSATVVPYEKTE